MSTVAVDVVRVFVDPSGDFGNPLGIVDGTRVPPADRRELAARLGYSETVYVDDPATGRLQIFAATGEMAFAGHPTVGVAWWLRTQGYPADVLHVPAGEVPVRHDGDLTSVRAHATWGSTFEWHQLPTPDDVLAADPAQYEAGHTFLWSWQDEQQGTIRARMFAPAMGVREDEATGSAVTQLTARLGRDLTVVQGAGSHLLTTYLDPDWVTVGGRVTVAAPRTLDY
ncbi:PhzF family phenazine biosynthesis protein [Kribbella amoyensis]|uniref:PhzF family phenazine biosynthesis protein n=1 Tax=Kribbella amoyensis TaxID=996641 RepID=A0A561BTR8_9ACTN|nr:PhzF family phenazine biosynthesis protein [Kribbella amoyensis]TWD82277.1 PhzF family phenazine biosynthesis protein [Kribbella amoyensis]